jgi:hypothetical protein
VAFVFRNFSRNPPLVRARGIFCCPGALAFPERDYSMLIGILITFLVIILILYLVNLLPIDGRAKQIVRIVVIVIGVLSLLRYLGYGGF